MKNFRQILLAVVLSSAPFCNPDGKFWAVGPLDSLEQMTTVQTVVAPSTGPLSNIVSNVVICSSTSASIPDCYRITVTPNGTLGTRWVTKPQ